MGGQSGVSSNRMQGFEQCEPWLRRMGKAEYEKLKVGEKCCLQPNVLQKVMLLELAAGSVL